MGTKVARVVFIFLAVFCLVGPIKGGKVNECIYLPDYERTAQEAETYLPVKQNMAIAVQSQVYTGKASWYGPGFNGRTTASGQTFDENALTAAHKELPFGTKVLVTNMTNGKSVLVTINDRGPYVTGRHIDLSRAAARKVDMIDSGIAEVKMEIIDLQ